MLRVFQHNVTVAISAPVLMLIKQLNQLLVILSVQFIHQLLWRIVHLQNQMSGQNK